MHFLVLSGLGKKIRDPKLGQQLLDERVANEIVKLLIIEIPNVEIFWDGTKTLAHCGEELCFGLRGAARLAKVLLI